MNKRATSTDDPSPSRGTLSPSCSLKDCQGNLLLPGDQVTLARRFSDWREGGLGLVIAVQPPGHGLTYPQLLAFFPHSPQRRLNWWNSESLEKWTEDRS